MGGGSEFKRLMQQMYSENNIKQANSEVRKSSTANVFLINFDLLLSLFLLCLPF